MSNNSNNRIKVWTWWPIEWNKGVTQLDFTPQWIQQIWELLDTIRKDSIRKRWTLSIEIISDGTISESTYLLSESDVLSMEHPLKERFTILNTWKNNDARNKWVYHVQWKTIGKHFILVKWDKIIWLLEVELKNGKKVMVKDTGKSHLSEEGFIVSSIEVEWRPDVLIQWYLDDSENPIYPEFKEGKKALGSYFNYNPDYDFNLSYRSSNKKLEYRDGNGNVYIRVKDKKGNLSFVMNDYETFLEIWWVTISEIFTISWLKLFIWKDWAIYSENGTVVITNNDNIIKVEDLAVHQSQWYEDKWFLSIWYWDSKRIIPDKILCYIDIKTSKIVETKNGKILTEIYGITDKYIVGSAKGENIIYIYDRNDESGISFITNETDSPVYVEEDKIIIWKIKVYDIDKNEFETYQTDTWETICANINSRFYSSGEIYYVLWSNEEGETWYYLKEWEELFKKSKQVFTSIKKITYDSTTYLFWENTNEQSYFLLRGKEIIQIEWMKEIPFGIYSPKHRNLQKLMNILKNKGFMGIGKWFLNIQNCKLLTFDDQIITSFHYSKEKYIFKNNSKIIGEFTTEEKAIKALWLQ